MFRVPRTPFLNLEVEPQATGAAERYHDHDQRHWAQRHSQNRLSWLVGLTVCLACALPVPPPPPVAEHPDSLDPAVRVLLDERVEATRRTPGDAIARAGLAAAYQANELPRLALEAYDQAIAIDPTPAAWWYQKARLHHGLGATKEASLAMDQAIDRAPTEPAPVCRKAFWALEQGHFDDARTAFEHALTLAPGSRVATIGLARLALEEARFDDARNRLEVLKTGHPRDRHVRHLLGVSHRGLGQLDQARVELARGSGSTMSWQGEDPWSAEIEPLRVGYKPQLARARALLSAGQVDRAISLLDRLLVDHPHDVAATTTLASAHTAKRAFDVATNLLTDLERVHPNEVAVHLNLGRVAQLRGHLPQALAHTDEALRLQPDLAFGLAQRARQLLMLEDFDQAIVAARQAIDADASSFEAWMLLGKAQFQRGQPAEATTTFEQASERFPHESEPFLLLAILRDRQGDREAAREAATQGLTREPNAAVARQLVSLARRLGMTVTRQPSASGAGS